MPTSAKSALENNYTNFDFSTLFFELRTRVETNTGTGKFDLADMKFFCRRLVTDRRPTRRVLRPVRWPHNSDKTPYGLTILEQPILYVHRRLKNGKSSNHSKWNQSRKQTSIHTHQIKSNHVYCRHRGLSSKNYYYYYELLTTENKQDRPADRPARRLRKVCTVYVRAVGL